MRADGSFGDTWGSVVRPMQGEFDVCGADGEGEEEGYVESEEGEGVGEEGEIKIEGE